MSTQLHRAAQARRPRPKRKSPVKLMMGGLAIVVLGFVAVVVAVIGYALLSKPNVNDLPLVLIHSPLNWEQVPEGDGVTVHATARSPGGIKRVELWVDDQLIAQREADQGEPPKSMVLSADWVPTIAGNHRLIVRATSASDVDGQASVAVESIETDETEPTGTHTVQEGETLTTIAERYGATTEDLTAINPGIDPATGPVPGTELIIPDDEPPSEGVQPLPMGSEAPPTAVGELPKAFTLIDFTGFYIAGDGPGEPIPLRMQVLALRTSLAYEGLNCYIGVADQVPRRYPDIDGDQSTDESFAILPGSPSGGASWNIGDYLDDDHAPIFSWPENQPLPFDMSCVGISGGGTQALQLGRIDLSIPPENWDGFAHDADMVGPEGSYGISYRIRRIDDTPPRTPKDPVPDNNMTPPTNLRAADRSWSDGFDIDAEDGSVSSFFAVEEDTWSLVWDYVPGADEEPASTFNIYLNDTLIGSIGGIPPITHVSSLPSHYRHPPCGEQYNWTVTALGASESRHSEPLIFENPTEGCGQWVSINFLTLETFDLGEDGRRDERHGDVGPVFGHIYANSHQVSFTGGALPRSGTGYVDYPYGLDSHTTYDLTDMDGIFRARFRPERPLRFLAVSVPWFEALDMGLVIWDDDDGSCDDPDDPGCDDLVCEVAVHMVPARDIHNNDLYEDSATSANDRCRLTYNYQLSVDSPIDRPE